MARPVVNISPNNPVFDLPSTSVTSSAFGTVTSSISEPRGWQIALKIGF